jgi:putative nucleotidyltransferase with HDIG domain
VSNDDLSQIPAGWEGISMPIRSAQAIVGVMLIFVPLPRELTTGEIQILNTLAEIVGIAIQRMRLHEKTEQQLQQLQALHEIDTVIASSFDLSFTLDIFLKNVLTELQVDAASILLLNPHTQLLDFTAGKGFRMPGIKQVHLGLSEGYAGRVALERRIIHSEDLPADNTSPAYTQLIDNENFVSYYGVPLVIKGEVKGVLEIFHRTPLTPNAEWLNFLEALASQAAIAIDSILTYNNLQRSIMELVMAYDMTLQGWSRALDMRDKETEGHSVRVTETTMQLARVLSVKDVEMEHIRRGALLHDVGKLGIPDSILHKPGPLTAEEWDVMRTHPVRAYELLSPIPHLRPALEIPYCHHEKWDGSGYPRGLKGEEIPLAARIFAVSDVYDALCSDRPYRKAWQKAKVLEHMKAESGTHFDPQVLEAFLKMIKTV